MQLFGLALLVLAQQPQLSPHLREGFAQLNQGRVAEAVETFEQLVCDDPEDGEAWYFLGLARHTAGELDLAIRGHLLATQLVAQGHPFRVNAHYNVACVYALQGKKERALQWLHRARNAGFANLAQVGQDADLKGLHDDPRFELFRAGGGIAQASEGSATIDSVTEVLPGGTGGVELGPDGVLYVANFGGEVWRIEPDGERAVLATGFNQAADCTLDGEGNLLQVDHGASRVVRIAPDGSTTDLGLEGLNSPVGIDRGSDGSLYVTNFRDDSILHVMPDGSSRRLAGGGLLNGPNGVAFAGEHGLFVVNYKDGTLLQLDLESGAERFVCELPGGGNGHVCWTGAELYVTDRAGHSVYRVTPEGAVTRVAGTGTRGTVDGDVKSGRLSLPNGIAVSAGGRELYVNDRLDGNRSVVRRIALVPLDR